MLESNATDVTPSFCPLCSRVEPGDLSLCAECGETLAPQGYCPICERFWPLSVGTPCPKHDVKLEAPSPRSNSPFPANEGAKWVTVGTFHDALQAEAARIRLEAEEIPTFLEGERMGSGSMYQVATGGVKLQVPESLASEARIVLSQSWTPPAVDDDFDDAWDELAPIPGARRRLVMKAIIVFILLAPLLMTLITYCLGS